MRKRYRNSEYVICEPEDVIHLSYLHVSQAEERKLRAIIDVLAEHGWRYQEEVQDKGYPCVVSFMVKASADQERSVFLNLRSSLLLYDLGLLLTTIEQAEHPHLTDGLQGLESLLRQRQREAELLAAYQAKHRR